MTGSPHDNSDHPATRHFNPAERTFVLALTILGFVLLALSPWQVTFFKNLRLFAQPAIWPVLALAGIAGFTLLHCLLMRKHNRGHDHTAVRHELLRWLTTVEYPLWFLTYVYVVPFTGYLVGTLLFCPLLTWRLGYRHIRPILLSIVAGLLIVVVFKSFLQVKIPGGALYEVFPPAIRNFMIINF